MPKKPSKQVPLTISPGMIMQLATLFLLCVAGVENFQAGAFAFRAPVNPLLLFWIFLTFSSIFFLIFSFSKNQRLYRINDYLSSKIHPLGLLNVVLAGILCVLFPIILFRLDPLYLQGFFTRFSILWILSLFTAFFLRGFYRKPSFIQLWLLSLLASTALYLSASFFRDLTTYRFSLAWSEGSRYYYASLPFSQKLYGQTLPWSFLHPARYLLMSLPFVFGELPLWIHRGWQIFLWIFLTWLGCAAIVQRLKIKDRLEGIAVAAWCFIFLLQGPVYYHLMICAILVLIGFDTENLKKSLLFVALASLWAGICRVNWFPLPAALAILLYILEKPIPQKEGLVHYLRLPMLYGIVGIGVSLISQAAYIPISGNRDPALFASSFTSDLLWYRLLPSPTYPAGILTGLFILITPPLILLSVNIRSINHSIHWLRRLILLGILAVFLAGGLVVSVKIGGGSNLHNLDAFLLLLTILCAHLVFNRIKRDESNKPVLAQVSTLLAIILILIPIGWCINQWSPFPKLDKAAAYQELQLLDESIQRVSAMGREILFVSERHLLTFGNIKGVKLVPDYELLTLMEMAISRNEAYLNSFYQDLARQRFGLIIIDKQYVIFKDATMAFPEENNAWVKSILVPLLEYYQPITWLRTSDTEIFAPRNLRAQAAQ
jgi:hypothetical protein